MFKFAHPEYLYLLLLIPALILLYAYGTWRNHLRKKQWGDAALFRTQTQGFSAQRPLFKFVLLLLALASGVLMLARPQYGTNSTTTENRRGIEVIFALDVSQSMLAQDVTPSRLERSKLFISNLVSRMDNDRVGFNVFAGEAYPILPLTGDLTSANFFLDNVNTNMVTLQGTNIASAIKLAYRGFSKRKQVGKAIIVITDGENHEEGAEQAAEEAAKYGCHVYVIGVGSTKGAEIPTPEGSLRDASGQVVHTALNESACEELAKAGKGAYFHLDESSNAQTLLQKKLDTLKRAENASEFSGSPNELFTVVTLCFVAILLGELFLSERQRGWTQRIKLFKSKS